MKTLHVIAVLALTLQTNVIFADNNPEYLDYNTDNKSKPLVTMASLAPATPVDADYNDIDLSCTIPFPASFFKAVLPALPRYAEFDDDILPVHVGKLIPAIPTHADF